MPVFSTPCGLSGGITHTITLKTEKNLTFSSLQTNIWKNPPAIVLILIFAGVSNQFEFSTPKCIFVPKFHGFLTGTFGEKSGH